MKKIDETYFATVNCHIGPIANGYVSGRFDTEAEARAWIEEHKRIELEKLEPIADSLMIGNAWVKPELHHYISEQQENGDWKSLKDEMLEV